MRSAIAVLLAASMTLLGSAPAGADHVDPADVIAVLAPDGIPAIMDPAFSPADWLAEEHGDGERVLAVVINGDARAYPLRILNWHEIVNDVVGGVPIAATFCPLCGTGITYERTVAGTVLTFKVSGRLYKNDLVMYDVESGPSSWWPQILGEAITGPWHGTKLALVSSTVVPWGDLKAAYPDVKLLARPLNSYGTWVRDYRTDPYAGYATSRNTLYPAEHVDTESGLHPKEFVLTVSVPGAAKVYPHRFLEQERVVNDAVGGIPIVVTYALGNAQAFRRGPRTFVADGDAMADGTGARYDLLTGEGGAGSLAAVDGRNAFWFTVFDHEIERAGHVDVYGIGVLRSSPGPRGLDASAWLLLLLGLGAFGAAAYGWRRARPREPRGG